MFFARVYIHATAYTLVQICISYGDALAVDELALYYGFMVDDDDALCAVDRAGGGTVLSAMGNRGGRAEADVVPSSPYEVAREVGRLAEIGGDQEGGDHHPGGGDQEGDVMVTRLLRVCRARVHARMQRLQRLLDEL